MVEIPILWRVVWPPTKKTFSAHSVMTYALGETMGSLHPDMSQQAVVKRYLPILFGLHLCRQKYYGNKGEIPLLMNIDRMGITLKWSHSEFYTKISPPRLLSNQWGDRDSVMWLTTANESPPLTLSSHSASVLALSSNLHPFNFFFLRYLLQIHVHGGKMSDNDSERNQGVPLSRKRGWQCNEW